MRKCESCSKPFEATRPQRRFCGDKCRMAAWQKRRDRELSTSLDEAERALRRVRQVVWGEVEDFS